MNWTRIRSNCFSPENSHMENDFNKLPESLLLQGKINAKVPHSIWIDGKPLYHRRSLQVRNHSPTGFAWGYTGSGPAQLALGLLLVYWLPRHAEEYYQQFKEVFIATLPQTDFTVEVELRRILVEIQEARQRRTQNQSL